MERGRNDWRSSLYTPWSRYLYRERIYRCRSKMGTSSISSLQLDSSRLSKTSSSFSTQVDQCLERRWRASLTPWLIFSTNFIRTIRSTSFRLALTSGTSTMRHVYRRRRPTSTVPSLSSHRWRLSVVRETDSNSMSQYRLRVVMFRADYAVCNLFRKYFFILFVFVCPINKINK